MGVQRVPGGSGEEGGGVVFVQEGVETIGEGTAHSWVYGVGLGPAAR